jgi:hypothetical protein
MGQLGVEVTAKGLYLQGVWGIMVCDGVGIWRRERDSNPRYPEVHTLSRRALSATQTPLRKGLINTRRLI